MRALIWRYIVNTHSEHEMNPVTKDDVHELKSDLSSWRCELLEILRRNGMDIASADTKERSEFQFDFRLIVISERLRKIVLFLKKNVISLQKFLKNYL